MRAFRVFAVITAVLCVCGVVSGQQFQHRGPGLAETTVMAGQTIDAGRAYFWNTGMPLDLYDTDAGNKLIVDIVLEPEWAVTAAQLYAGRDEVPTKKGNPALVIKDCEPGSEDHEAAAAAWRKHEVPF